ncbi:MAG: BsaWI family type II restriction enzyme [Candidatus Binataceae bacterium]
MARLECRSSQPGIVSQWVEVEHITDAEVARARARLGQLLKSEEQVSTAVALAFVEVTTACPAANPSDLWQHVIYRHLLERGWSDQRWKRVSGFALERALVELYRPRLSPHGIRSRILKAPEANMALSKLGITETKATKVDLFLEGQSRRRWLTFGVAHVKSSIAERIQDDVPASRAFMERGLLSIALTMDAKSYPPPHGNCINYGELGGRSLGVEKERLKRNYIEVDGQFDGLFSFNLRTPPSPATTPSGKRIYTMSLHEKQPDQLVRFLVENRPAHGRRA